MSANLMFSAPFECFPQSARYSIFNQKLFGALGTGVVSKRKTGLQRH